uniref:TPR_REGION domain-containing protein n=1 Tax=Caenorhabditis tropicalis TaxID=1561998 RepID=A0A1I7V1H2_9PELO
MEEPSGLGTSKDRPIEIEDEEEESSDENSTIILDSDTEKEDAGEEEENGVEEAEDSESESEEEDSDESVEDEEDSDSSVDTDSVNSLWSDMGEKAGNVITTEAAEAKIMKKYETAIHLIADQEAEKGRKILENLLEDPLLTGFVIEDLDYEVLEEPPRLAKMLQIFIFSHKNLAKLCEKAIEIEPQDHLQIEEIQHLCQVLGYEPNNAEIWLDVALKSVEIGDLNLAKYAFKRCEHLNESMESHATLLYLTCDFNQCLMILKQFQEQNDVLNDKMKYLKMKIRDTNTHFKQLCDRIFDEDDVYADIDYVEKRKILAFDERIEELRKKIEGRKEKKTKEFEEETGKMSTLKIQISADQDLPTVCTLFCDLFDRIHNYSHCREQLIEITEWDPRDDYLQVVETVEKLVDIVECVEEMTQKTEESLKKKKGKRQKQQEKKEYLASWRKRLFVEDVVQETTEVANSTADEEEEDGSQVEEEKRGGMPENELAHEFNLVYSDVVSIMAAQRKRERTPPPSEPSEFINLDTILQLLEAAFSGGTHTILDLLEHTLRLLSTHSPTLGALPDSMKPVTVEMYHRLCLYSEIKKYHRMNVFLMELDSEKALEAMVLRHFSPYFEENQEEEEEVNEREKRLFMLRFMWKYSKTGLDDEIRLDYLSALRSLLETDETVATSSGSFATWDVDNAIDDLNKKKRIESVKHLWKTKNYQNLIEILQNDIDFSTIGIDEAIELISYWIQSLEKMKSVGELLNMISRALHFYLFAIESAISEARIERNLEFLLHKLQRIFSRETLKISRKRLPTISTIGFFICCAFKKYPKFEKDWRNWRVLYDFVATLRGDEKEYIQKLDKGAEPTVMPLLELDLLVKAHEVLGEHRCCAQRDYEFLFFIVDAFRKLIDNIPILELCYMKDNGYLWNNLNLELSQVLFCLFGKFSRKNRARENHENGGECATTLEISKRIMAVILVQPLPLYDEKEKLMHDVIELLNSKFPFLLEIPAKKEENIKEFKEFLQKSECLEDVNQSLQKCQDDVDDNIQSLVWYAMALSAFRQNGFKAAAKYSELYLLTEESNHDDRLRSSVWGMLAHASVHDLFQLELHEIYSQWKWRIMPFRMAVAAQEKEPVPHFELASILYQLASSLARFHRTLQKDDQRLQDIHDVQKLRQESREQFDKCLELTKIGDDGSQPEHQWLCYYFIAKLEAKMAKWDVLKVVEFFYEAACGCELTGFYYPQKVQTKKQTNFEPLEVHYQAFSAVYKYLISNETPDLGTLRRLKVWLKLLTDGHKVVKPNSSLFKVNLDVYTVVDELVMDTVFKENEISDDTLSTELIAELKDSCARAFSLITDRFPHMKSYYRLSQIHFERGEIDEASNQIFKNALKRKKRDDSMFDNCVEISCNDINRNGSYSFHIERCIKMGAQIALKTQDLHNVVSMLTTMINVVGKDDEEHVDKTQWKSIVVLYLSTMEKIVTARGNISCRSTPSPGPDGPPKKRHHLGVKTLRIELWRLWQLLLKCAKPGDELIGMIRTKTDEMIKLAFQSIENLRNRMHPQNSDAAKLQKKAMKRKLDDPRPNALQKPNVNLNDLALRLAQNQLAGLGNKTLNDIARQFSMNPQDANKMKAISEFAAKFMQAQKNAQAPSSSIPSTSSAPLPLQSSVPAKPSAPPPRPPPPVRPPAQVKPPAPAAPSGVVRPIARYSPISDDDDIQCLDPPAPKRPALQAPPLAKSSQPGVQMVPSVFGGFKSVPGAGTSGQKSSVPPPPKPAPSIVKPVAQPAQSFPDTFVRPVPLPQKPNASKPIVPIVKPVAQPPTSTQKPIQKPPPKPQTSIVRPVPQKPSSQMTPEIARPVAQSTGEQLHQILTRLMTSGDKKELEAFIRLNANSTDPQKQILAAQGYQLLSQLMSPSKIAPTLAAPSMPTQLNAQLMEALASYQKLQAQQNSATQALKEHADRVKEQQMKEQRQKEEAAKRAEAERQKAQKALIAARKEREAKALLEAQKALKIKEEQQQREKNLLQAYCMLAQQQNPNMTAINPMVAAQQMMAQKNRQLATSASTSRLPAAATRSPQAPRPSSSQQQQRPQAPPPAARLSGAPPTSRPAAQPAPRLSQSVNYRPTSSAAPQNPVNPGNPAANPTLTPSQEQAANEQILRMLNSIPDINQRNQIIEQLLKKQ